MAEIFGKHSCINTYLNFSASYIFSYLWSGKFFASNINTFLNKADRQNATHPSI